MKKNQNLFMSLRACAAVFLLAPFATQAQAPDTLIAVRDNSLNTMMSVHQGGSLFLGGTYDGDISGTGVPAEGMGTRLMWYPRKAAFRAGYVGGTQWDAANIGDYSVAMGIGVRASASNSVAFGFECTAAQVSSFAVGESNTASGAASVAMGYHAHTNARQGSFVFADRSSVDTLRAGVNHSANWRTSGGFRIFTASNLSTGVTIQSGASVSNWGQASAVISTSTGALLTTGGVWQNASDVNRKHLFEAVSGEDVLHKLRNLDIKEWSYRTEADNIRHIGPTSQDFYAAFGLGTDTRSIGTVDADGIALAGVKALDARTQQQATAFEDLKAENLALRKRLEALERHSTLNAAGFSWPVILVLAGILLAGLLLRRRAVATSFTKK